MQLNGKSALVIITGASRGIGRELAVELSKLFNKKSCFLLLSRNEAALADVKDVILKNNAELRVETYILDLSQPYTENVHERVEVLEAENSFDIRLIIHNAGSLGDLTKRSSELNDETQWHLHLQTNLITTIHLNNKIFAALKKEASSFIVNITSLLSIKPFPSFTQYSVAKAAREAYFRALATEHPNCRVLSYSPGPVDTDMHTQVCDNTYDNNVRQIFSRRYDNGPAIHRKLLTTAETVNKFLRVLEANKFENGSRVDYFDK